MAHSKYVNKQNVYAAAENKNFHVVEPLYHIEWFLYYDVKWQV